MIKILNFNICQTFVKIALLIYPCHSYLDVANLVDVC